MPPRNGQSPSMGASGSSTSIIECCFFFFGDDSESFDDELRFFSSLMASSYTNKHIASLLYCIICLIPSKLNITYKDRRTNIWAREWTKVIDITSHKGPFKCYVTLFPWNLDPHPPPRNANNVEPYTFVTLFPLIDNVRKMKWPWAGHINYLKDD